MVSFPNAKINLGLNVTRKRADGFHDIETVFYPVACCDALELIAAPNQAGSSIFTSTGLKVDGNAADNLCIKAYNLLKKDFPSLPAVQIHLHKVIPMGAGLGGGSADAAFMLKMLDQKFKLQVPEEKLAAYALQLGSDCPFFLTNKPAYATGRGELLEPIAVDLSPYSIVLINPGIHVNTGLAFSKLTPALPAYSLKEIILQPVDTWKDRVNNDFEKSVFEMHPAVGEVKDFLYQQGAIYASMSGSGSTVFGIFEKHTAPVPFPGKDYFTRTIV